MKMIINNLTGVFKDRSRWACLCLLWVALAFPVTAAAERITVHDFALYEGNTKELLVADIRFDYQLTEFLRKSLLNGITLRSEVRFDLVWHSDWWWNKTEPLDSIVNELKYHALTRQYQLVNKKSNENWNFSNLATALQHLGKVSKHPLPKLPESAFKGDAAIYVEAVLEPRVSKALGVQSKLSSLFSSEKHDLTSQGVLWQLTP
uniref:DUF4390 domain-containing protein n=1 Tax=uncultured Thiotrichaceae bacterium TaxID=298394 RepID=A0A6S6UF68_9GAMM|nr:MAG: Unknown protein [uncultured Thiotrichaceae bacterium]